MRGQAVAMTSAPREDPVAIAKRDGDGHADVATIEGVARALEGFLERGR